MNLEKILSIGFLVPLGNPNDPACLWGLPLMLWGEPGIGKSDRVEAAGRMVSLPVRTTYAATSQPEDASGTAFVNTSKAMAMLDSLIFTLESALEEDWGQSKSTPAWLSYVFSSLRTPFLQKLVKSLASASRRYGGGFARIEPLLPGLSDLLLDQQGVWFLDELSCARPAVQAGFLGAVLARRVGGLRLPPSVRIVGAANPPESAAGGWELEPPMANRFCHFNIPTPSINAWNDWLLNEGGETFDPIENGEARVRENWSTEWPSVKGLISGFLTANAGLLHHMPAEGSKDRGRAWPSPRTWSFAARAQTTCRILGAGQDLHDAFLEGCVGSAATPYVVWLKNADLPSPSDVLTKGWKIDKHRLDRCVAVYTSMVAHVTSTTDHDERKRLAVLAWNRLEEAKDANLLDLTLRYAHALVRAGLDSRASQEIATASHPVMKELAKRNMGQQLT